MAMVVGCATQFTGSEQRSGAPQQPAQPWKARPVKGPVGTLGTAVMAALARAGSGNVAVSPTVLAVQLAMVRAGAAGTTAPAIDQLFGVQNPAASEELVAATGSIDAVGSDRTGPQRSAVRRGRVDIEQAAALWLQRGTDVDDAYLDTLASVWGTGVRLVDFRSDPERARDAINRWASDTTDGRAEQLVARGRITSSAQLVSTGVLWLSAPWLWPFDPAATRTTDFTTDTGRTVAVPMMQLGRASGLSYAGGDGWQAVELPYLGRQLSMVAVLPAPGRTDEVVNGLSTGLLDDIVGSLRPTAVTVALPRFAFTTQPSLATTLSDLGAGELFDVDRADLTALAPAERLALTDVVQELFVAVDEQGTAARATASTSGGATRVPTAATEVTFDRPFVVLMVDRASGLVFVAARIGDPTT